MNDISAEQGVIYIVGIAAVFLIWYALRSVVLWYYKIDKLLENQINTELVLKDILAELQKNNNKDTRYFDKE